MVGLVYPLLRKCGIFLVNPEAAAVKFFHCLDALTRK
jgi:hypothetical protein